MRTGLAISVLMLTVVQAAGYDRDKICQGPPELEDKRDIRLMRVIAKDRVQFIESNFGDKSKCPSLDAACRRKGFVVKDDLLLTYPPKGDLVCATYIAPNVRRVKGQFAVTDGFLPAAALVDVAIPAAKPSDFIGKWYRNAEAEIEIKAGKDDKLVIEGSATYGAFDPYRVKNGAVNEGGLEGAARPRGNMLAIGEGYDGSKPFDEKSYECQARLELFGRYLVVQDSGFCGGANVRFDGIYVRLKN